MDCIPNRATFACSNAETRGPDTPCDRHRASRGSWTSYRNGTETLIAVGGGVVVVRS